MPATSTPPLQCTFPVPCACKELSSVSPQSPTAGGGGGRVLCALSAVQKGGEKLRHSLSPSAHSMPVYTLVAFFFGAI